MAVSCALNARCPGPRTRRPSSATGFRLTSARRRWTPRRSLWLTRMDVDTPRIEDTVECFGATVVPRLADARGVSAGARWSWRHRPFDQRDHVGQPAAAAAASRAQAAADWVDPVQSTGALIQAGRALRPGVQHRAHRGGINQPQFPAWQAGGPGDPADLTAATSSL